MRVLLEAPVDKPGLSLCAPHTDDAVPSRAYGALLKVPDQRCLAFRRPCLPDPILAGGGLHEFRLLDLSEHRLDHLLRMSLNTGHEMAAIRGQNLFVVGQSR
jgi:hypothetical protein